MKDQKSVLLVEDEPEIVSVITGLLETLGFKVFSVAEGREVLRKIKACQPDVVLLDLGLPDTDGYHVLRQLRNLERSKSNGNSKDEHLPVLIMTGRGLPTQVLCESEGIDGYLKKPFDIGDLLKAIARALHANPEEIDSFGTSA